MAAAPYPLVTPKGVRFIRTEMKLRQEDLARRMAVHRHTVIRWESGEVQIPEPMARLLRLLYREWEGRARKSPRKARRR